MPLSVVCFQYRTADVSKHGDEKYLDDLNSRLLDALEKDGAYSCRVQLSTAIERFAPAA